MQGTEKWLHDLSLEIVQPGDPSTVAASSVYMGKILIKRQGSGGTSPEYFCSLKKK